MTRVFFVEIVVTVCGGRVMSDDAVTDLIEVLIDELDQFGVEPSVGTMRNGDEVDVTVGVVIDDDGAIDAMAQALAMIRSALDVAGVHATEGTGPRMRRITSQASAMQPAL